MKRADNENAANAVDERPQTRRDLLKTAGRFAAYTPPVVMMMMAPSRDAFAQSGGSDDASSDDDSSS